MTANRDLDRRLADFYASEAPPRAPDWVLDSALATIETTPQRRAFNRVPWRFPTMNNYAKVAIAAVAVIAIGAIGLAIFIPGRAPGPGGQASPSPSPSPSPSGPALTETYTSSIHGISVSYPRGWTLLPATEPWTTGFVQQGVPFADTIYEKEVDSPFIALASQSLAGKTGDQWAADYVASMDCGPTEPITVDGAPGVLAPQCGEALVWVGERGYLIWLYRVNDPAWFDQILASVQLDPENAIDTSPSPASSARPSASP